MTTANEQWEPGTMATPAQRGFIVTLAYRKSPRVTAHTPREEVAKEIENLTGIPFNWDLLDRSTASKVIDKLLSKE